MKHSLQVLLIFLGLFVVSQFIGLFLIFSSSDVVVGFDEESDREVTEVVFSNTSVGERPDIEGSQTLLAIAFGVFFGTVVLLLLSKFNKVNIWKHWFFFASIITMSVSFGVIFNNFLFAWVLAFVLGVWKVYRSNTLIHNLTELFIYPGIALLIAPLLNVFYAFLLLVLISIYDAYAVWKSKHMVTMAKFARGANLFPGLAVSYNKKTGSLVNKKREAPSSKKSSSKRKSDVVTGILGGGDIAFPLIFSSVFLIFLLEQGFSGWIAFIYAFIISLFAGVALLLLFLFGKKDRFYPAMPFISAGCFLGYLFVLLLLNIF